MAGVNGGFEDDPAGCYTQLLCGDEIITGLETDSCFGFGSSSIFSSDNHIVNTPKMLCFGDYENGKETGRVPGPACMVVDPTSLSSTKISSSLPNSTKKRNGSGILNSGGPTGSRRNSKKSKPENSITGGHAKVVKKEKLGERIAALQQLVSPFGKTDTASVLHEALGYIRFLHDQVQVLCSPYLQRPKDGESNKADERRTNDLRSRGLCLVPIDLTLHVAESNGADMWSSAAMIDSVVSSS
ncbi:hypothetical protein MIMGU_mgv1a021642mg [Erythranthe guttata]|uniref:BHLH domain-containing protein n=1 Tax=Erythranthe guttata TaxID=4155 RepID=A0A022RRS7_ERYGU|nr:PREDICTED: transcription factor bHLH113-like [Erythranthe guttata]EYU42706.1 hypothetical protein MIMGU_mgv1a021642mg [Erythranthe guttata]|eukprot:XP_012830957.1 PREDICTED: transcription factor bHLH113-like [Erythranthe guttata]